MSTILVTDQAGDPEKLPLDTVVDIEKPLPDWPAPVWGGPGTREANMSWAGDASISSDGDSDRNILPIFALKSKYSQPS